MSVRSMRRRDRDFGEMWDSFNDFFGDNFLASIHSGDGGDNFSTDSKDTSDRYPNEAEIAGLDHRALAH
ncbi:hypothetical protein HHO41_00675 [Bacillus sp. DNRA2]|uniref:hypothetical protein n=1 Tax=Bacillus sp. DNRA2 TaxID=2723053 RepID=UPI00145E9AD8|nr:hypothetical protein [Bacillus sp. DNRA2]NMD68781.1 hypothetical protein [Bacillus sp. DNRA2]